MSWVRRTTYASFACDADGRWWSHSLLTGRSVLLEDGDLTELGSLPAREWVWRHDARARELAERGLLVSDDPGEPFRAFRERERSLRTWLPAAAAFYLATRWRGVDVGATTMGERLRNQIDSLPEIPPAVHAAPDAVALIELPVADDDSELAALLTARRTRRSYRRQPLPRDALSTLLRYVWGAHGRTETIGGYTTLRKTSASGGALHPVETYPLVIDVEGLESGLYHYRSDVHVLELLTPLAAAEARELASLFTAGQHYFADAAALFVMAARVQRNFWKYRRHEKAFRVLLLDAGHLSQTFYLVAQRLGLGAFVTAALNEVDIEEHLRLDPYEHAVLAICGCGWATRERSETYEREVLPFVPRESDLER